MTINFNLFTPDKKVSAIRVVIYHRGKTYRKAIGVSCNTADWSVKKQKCVNIEKDAQVKRIRLRLEEKLNEQSSPEYIAKVLEWATSDKEVEFSPQEKDGKIVPTFWAYFQQWADRPSKSITTRRGYYSAVKRLMETSENWEDIDCSYYFRLVRAMEDAQFAKNTQGTIIGCLKTVMREGVRLKYHSNLDFMDFKRMSEDPDTVYLTEDELQKLWEVEDLTDNERNCRDLFLIGVYTASRYSDCSRLSMTNIIDGKLHYTQKKTGESVVMPAGAKLIKLLKRNGGSAPEVDNYNITIKRVCKKAGIDTYVEVTRTNGNRPNTRKGPKWKFVGSHTARRTGATMLYMSGVPLKQCMFITGHKSEANFMRYIRITKEETAAALASNPFFK